MDNWFLTISSIVDKREFGVAIRSKQLKFAETWLNSNGELKEADCEFAKICFITSKKEILNLPQGNSVTSVENQKYYVGAVFECGTYVLKRVINRGRVDLKFINLDQTILDDDALYIRVPPGKNLKTNDISTIDYLFVGKDSAKSLPEFENRKCYFSPLGEEERISMTESITLIGRDCIDSCYGRKCNAFDDCGNRCGCPVGMNCNTKTGECETVEHMIVKHWHENEKQTWTVTILLIIALILFIILICYLIWRQKT
ncbi:MAG: hypothetical protein Solivirus4_14 [Solivirus sp.]|uniref:Uncharacterized protein n=1 Tax=Solivirus sp. TaxID=2487772 RepID=A0A3G5AJH8_9VIRU|nr:MAG: hypothetical protein Solivirus4_14 [Solivirus sp.]